MPSNTCFKPSHPSSNLWQLNKPPRCAPLYGEAEKKEKREKDREWQKKKKERERQIYHLRLGSVLLRLSASFYRLLIEHVLHVYPHRSTVCLWDTHRMCTRIVQLSAHRTRAACVPASFNCLLIGHAPHM